MDGPDEAGPRITEARALSHKRNPLMTAADSLLRLSIMLMFSVVSGRRLSQNPSLLLLTWSNASKAAAILLLPSLSSTKVTPTCLWIGKSAPIRIDVGGGDAKLVAQLKRKKNKGIGTFIQPVCLLVQRAPTAFQTTHRKDANISIELEVRCCQVCKRHVTKWCNDNVINTNMLMCAF